MFLAWGRSLPPVCSYFLAMGVRICFISSMMPSTFSGFSWTTFSRVLHTLDCQQKKVSQGRRGGHSRGCSRASVEVAGLILEKQLLLSEPLWSLLRRTRLPGGPTLQTAKVLPYSSSVSSWRCASTARSL